MKNVVENMVFALNWHRAAPRCQWCLGIGNRDLAPGGFCCWVFPAQHRHVWSPRIARQVQDAPDLQWKESSASYLIGVCCPTSRLRFRKMGKIALVSFSCEVLGSLMWVLEAFWMVCAHLKWAPNCLILLKFLLGAGFWGARCFQAGCV